MCAAEDDISHDSMYTGDEASPMQCIDAEAQDHDSDLDESATTTPGIRRTRTPPYWRA